jgi:hypothetical protein
MIQTKTEITYGDRSERNGIIKVEVRQLEVTTKGVKFLVIDWDISKPDNDPIFSKEVFYTNETINGLDTYISANNDFTGLSRVESEYKKLQIGLMLDTQTNLLPSGSTIYRLTPSDWEFSI